MEWISRPRYRLPLDDAEYAWPGRPQMTIEWFGSGDPVIALALMPHANEPLGYALHRPLEKLADGCGQVAVVWPVDPPPADRCFPLPCDFREFLRTGYLQPLEEQTEFAHTAVPVTPAQHHAADFRRLVRLAAPAALILVHNDAFSRIPYMYGNRRWPEAERLLASAPAGAFPDAPLDEVEWTHHLGPRTYSYFAAAQIGITDSEAAGLYIERTLRIPVLTAELPMFDWTGISDELRIAVRMRMEQWIEDGCGDVTSMVADSEALLAGRSVPMIAPEVSARALHAVLEGVRAELDG
ncbi:MULTISPECIES: hypothetical protein [Streptomyces]|uniref:hypothetical protein n=1 Tax=Streptomyces TaxID=1883 RepID=UPI0018DEFD9A|nr:MULTISPECIES: hypothetical protein [Streptomyces]MCZ4097822.1 hypothetical protein [Streptomyces sp. H39-C1]